MPARNYEVQHLNATFNLNLSQQQQDSIAVAVANAPNVDLERIVLRLGLKDKIRVRDIVAAFFEKTRRTSAERCGKCRDGWLPMFDWKLWRNCGKFPITSIILIPKLNASCTCGTDPGRYQDRIHVMDDEERAWTYVILYDYWVYALGNLTPPDEFSPQDIWKIEIEDVTLNATQISIMNDIHINCLQRVDPARADEIIRQTIHKIQAKEQMNGTSRH